VSGMGSVVRTAGTRSIVTIVTTRPRSRGQSLHLGRCRCAWDGLRRQNRWHPKHRHNRYHTPPVSGTVPVFWEVAVCVGQAPPSEPLAPEASSQSLPRAPGVGDSPCILGGVGVSGTCSVVKTAETGKLVTVVTTRPQCWGQSLYPGRRRCEWDWLRRQKR
jgi:hypothetical protein